MDPRIAEPGFAGTFSPSTLGGPAETAQAAIAAPMNYGQVAPGIYRSGFPTKHNISFLERLNLRTILLLDDGESGKEHTAEVHEWIKASGIRVVRCIMGVNREPFTVMDPLAVKTAITVLLDKSTRGSRATRLPSRLSSAPPRSLPSYPLLLSQGG